MPRKKHQEDRAEVAFSRLGLIDFEVLRSNDAVVCQEDLYDAFDALPESLKLRFEAVGEALHAKRKQLNEYARMVSMTVTLNSVEWTSQDLETLSTLLNRTSIPAPKQAPRGLSLLVYKNIHRALRKHLPGHFGSTGSALEALRSTCLTVTELEPFLRYPQALEEAASILAGTKLRGSAGEKHGRHQCAAAVLVEKVVGRAATSLMRDASIAHSE